MKSVLAKTYPDRNLFPHVYKDKKRVTYHKEKLGEHHLFELLDWNPQAIKNTADLWLSRSSMTLEGLYHLLVETGPKGRNAVSVSMAA